MKQKELDITHKSHTDVIKEYLTVLLRGDHVILVPKLDEPGDLGFVFLHQTSFNHALHLLPIADMRKDFIKGTDKLIKATDIVTSCSQEGSFNSRPSGSTS